MPIHPIDPSHVGIIETSVLVASLDICREMGISASHPNLDVLQRHIRSLAEGSYILGLTGRVDVNDQERTDVGEAIWLRYTPASGEPGDVPVYGELGPYVQPPVGRVRR